MQIKISRFILVVIGVIIVNILLILSVSGLGTGSRTLNNRRFDQLPLKSGDLVLRSGHGLISKWFRQCSLQDPVFSHAGLIIEVNNQVLVAHVQQTKSGSPLCWEPVSDFWSKDICSKGAVYRSDLNESQLKLLIESVLQDSLQAPEYDYEFELNADNKLYCSEWIREKFITASGDINYFPVTSIDDYHYVAPDNLYRNAHSKFVYSFIYP